MPMILNRRRKRKPSKVDKRAAPNPLRADPTRMATQRRMISSELNKSFGKLKAAILHLVVKEDAFGLSDEPPRPLFSGNLDAVLNSFFSECERDDKGHCLPGEGGSPHPGKLSSYEKEVRVPSSKIESGEVEIAKQIAAGHTPEGWNKADMKAIEKYRKEYRKKKEEGWQFLPQAQNWKGKVVIGDGSHRVIAALLEGASSIRFAWDTRTGSPPTVNVINCGGPGSGVPGPCPKGAAGTTIKPKGFRVHEDGANVSVKLETSRGLHMPGIGEVESPGPVALADATEERGQLTLTKVHADEELRGSGAARGAIARIAEVAVRRNLPFRTTGVFSTAGKQMMEKMVRDGLAIRVGAGDYEIDRHRMVKDYVHNLLTNCGGPGSGVPGPCPRGIGPRMVDGLKRIGAKAGHIEHALKAYAADKVASAVSKLPTSVQPFVTGAFMVAKVGTSVAFATWTAGQAMAERVAIQRGATPEQARRLRGVLSTLDVTTMKPIVLGLEAAHLGAGAIGVASMIPPATASYLAYSTARNPLATMRAARGAVGDAIRGVARRGSLGPVGLAADELGNQVADALASHGWGDWYISLLSAALDEVGDVTEAIGLANQLHEENPPVNLNPKPGDAREVLGFDPEEMVINLFSMNAEEFFKTCQRDDKGHCMAGAGGAEKKGKGKGKKAEEEKVEAVGHTQHFPPEVSGKERVAEIKETAVKFEKEHKGATTPKELLKTYFGSIEAYQVNEFLRGGEQKYREKRMKGWPKPGEKRFGGVGATYEEQAAGLEKQVVEIKETVSKLRHATKNSPIESHGETVYRRIDLKIVDQAKVGDVLTDPGYMSTTLSQAFGRGDPKEGKATLVIKSARKTKVLFYAKEAEVVFPEGTSLRVVGIRRQGNERFIFAEMLPHGHAVNVLVGNAVWRFQSTNDQRQQFKAWLMGQVRSEIVGRRQEDVWRRFIEEGFRKGADRAFEDVRSKGGLRSGDGIPLSESPDWYRGTKEEFLRSAFSQPVAVEKVKLLAGRAFDDLEGISTDMSNRIVRRLTDGLVRGASPRDLGRELAAEVDLGRGRADRIARTEIVRAHAEGQLEALEGLGVEEVGVMVEWSTVGDDKVCDLCAPLQGVVLKIDEAKGMLPRHPNCRCAWIPANVGEDEEDQKRTSKEVKAAVKESHEEAGDSDTWAGPDKEIASERLTSILDQIDSFDEQQRQAEEGLTREGLRERLDAASEDADSPNAKRFAEADEVRKILEEYSKEDGEPQEHGMSGAEKMRTITVGGKVILYPEGSGGIVPTIQAASEGLPPRLWEANDRIILTSGKNKDDPHWAREYGRLGFTSAATGGDGQIVVYHGDGLPRHRMAHESGHNLANQMWGTTKPPESSRYGMLQKVEGPVTAYGSKSPSEDFADACRMYVENPAALESGFPQKYAEIHRIMTGGA